MGMERLQTEVSLTDFTGIDTWDDARILDALAAGQERAIAAVRAAAPSISAAATALASRLSAGGKLFYAGAGTSIRIAVQDGSELPATFGLAEERIGYLIAGGRAAMFDTIADAEDDAEEGARAAEACGVRDTLIAVAASGTTPYTTAAARRAHERGCFVIAIVNNAGSPFGATADAEIVLNSGPEVIAGSTRMGAGTAQKAAINLLSTLTFIKLGAVHDGMMVNVQAGNRKLRRRAAAIVSRITGASETQSLSAIDMAQGSVKAAVLICAGAKDDDAAQKLLGDANGILRQALKRLAAP